MDCGKQTVESETADKGVSLYFFLNWSPLKLSPFTVTFLPLSESIPQWLLAWEKPKEYLLHVPHRCTNSSYQTMPSLFLLTPKACSVPSKLLQGTRLDLLKMVPLMPLLVPRCCLLKLLYGDILPANLQMMWSHFLKDCYVRNKIGHENRLSVHVGNMKLRFELPNNQSQRETYLCL